MKIPIATIQITLTIDYVESSNKSIHTIITEKLQAKNKTEKQFFESLLVKGKKDYSTHGISVELIHYNSRTGSFIIEASVAVFAIVSGYGSFFQGLEYIEKHITDGYSALFSEGQIKIIYKGEKQYYENGILRGVPDSLFSKKEILAMKFMTLLILPFSIVVFVLSYLFPRTQKNIDIKVEYKVNSTKFEKDTNLIKYIEPIIDSAKKVGDTDR